MTRKTRELNSDDFQRLLVRLDVDPAKAVAKYTQLREHLKRFCLSHDAHFMAEELADKAIDEVAKKGDDEPIRDVEQYTIGILRMLLLAHRRKSPPMAVEDLERILDKSDVEHSILDRLDRERKKQCFVNCMKYLKPDERRLVLEYYPTENRDDLEGRRKRLAAKLFVQPGTLATRMNRLRNRLERCCLNCYRRSATGQKLHGEKRT